ncbi:MAG: M28 family peptidase [Candidatus Acidiferrales bacterium]
MLLRRALLAAALAGAAILPAACGHDAAPSNAAAAATPASSPSATSSATSTQPAIAASDEPPPASQTGGFDGAAAYDYTAKLVAFGPRPPASDAIHRTQDYIISQLKSFGCAVDTDDFHAETPIGTLPMKNIIAKVPGTGQGIILLLTHYDTLRLDNFVGADDGGSSSGLMLEMARLLCAGPKRKYAVWIAFLDGEEAQVVTNGVAQWTDADSVYGSRELAARLDLSGDLKHVRAVILADMIGQKNLHILRESDSTKWLTNLVWSTADRLGYANVFLSSETQISDDHQPFLKRNVPAVDIIDFDDYSNAGYWHTPQDTMDKLSPRSFSIVGYVILESVAELQR